MEKATAIPDSRRGRGLDADDGRFMLRCDVLCAVRGGRVLSERDGACRALVCEEADLHGDGGVDDHYGNVDAVGQW